MKGKITDIENMQEGAWVNLDVKVLELWENEHESIRQVGLLQDETGITKFVAWKKSELLLLEEGANYKLGKMPVSKYDDYLQVAMVKTTRIERVGGEQTEIPVA